MPFPVSQFAVAFHPEWFSKLLLGLLKCKVISRAIYFNSSLIIFLFQTIQEIKAVLAA